MFNSDSVIWLNSADEIAEKISAGLNNPEDIVLYAQNWFDIINQQPANATCERIWSSMKEILNT
ncbi:hypothetical protein ACQ9BO_25875 [Flavobacterium sp. P21]|uniref:hypothetical protein n=1 Tax=Flavobacterium sp. P21 TaxID=3423948 RepID=UPI003D67C288